MFQKFSKTDWKTLDIFMDNPYVEYHLRDIARLAKISSSSAKRALDNLVKTGLVNEKNKANLRIFSANNSEILFKQLKISKNVHFTKSLVEKLKPAIAVILFGSFAKGENSVESDIDMVVISNKRFDINEFKDFTVQLHNFTPAGWAKAKKNNKAFVREVLEEGITMYGEKPK
ncbi:MAG: nucleotidyltransferase domain-containing protein [Candidatus Nanoarchaeia archaeon]